MTRVAFLSFSLVVLSRMAASAETQGELNVEPLAAAVGQCWTAGSGASYLKICISKHGNVVRVESPAGIENIARGEIAEGYVACASSAPGKPGVSYYDTATTESGWAAPYKITTSPSRVYRKTTDGALELVQSFSLNAEEMDFNITMTLYNRSGKTLYNVRLDRYADFDVYDSVQGDTFHRTPRSVFAADSNGVLNMADLGKTAATTAVHRWSEWQKNICNQTSVMSPTEPGDWLGRISYSLGTLAGGASKTIKLVYSVQ